VAERLVPSSAYTGKTTLLKSFHASSEPEYHPLARIRLQIFDFDHIVDVAVVPDLGDNVLLGTDLGPRNLATWLVHADDSTWLVHADNHPSSRL